MELVQANERMQQRPRMSTLNHLAIDTITQAMVSLNGRASTAQTPTARIHPGLRPAALPFIQPYDAPIFKLVQDARLDELHELLASDQCLVNAVDPYGLSAYYYASYYCLRHLGLKAALQTVSALLQFDQHGDAPEWLDDTGSLPCHTLLDGHLAEYAKVGISLELMTSVLDEIATAFAQDRTEMWQRYMRSRAFPPGHRVLLALDACASLSTRLSSLKAEHLHQKDRTGRTLLTWAVEYRWPEAISRLRQLGLQANTALETADGHLPLLHLALAGPYFTAATATTIVEELLKAGADVCAQDHQCWTAMHVALSWRLFAVVETLRTAGDVTLARQLLTTDGYSAFDLACQAGASEIELVSAFPGYCYASSP